MCSSILKTREENIRYYLSNRIFKYIQEPTFLISSNRRIPCPNACVHKIAKKKKKKIPQDRVNEESGPRVEIVSWNFRDIRNEDQGHNSDGKDDDDGHKEARDQSLWPAYADLKRDRAKLVSRASTRDLQLPRCFIRQPVPSSRFSSLLARTRTNQRTNEGRLSRIPAATSTALPVRESDKSGTGKYIRRDLRRDFEESSCIPGGIVRLCSRDHHLWCIMDGSNFFLEFRVFNFSFPFFRISIDISVDDLDCSEPKKKGLGRRARIFELRY